jgi:hypothetical protein
MFHRKILKKQPSHPIRLSLNLSPSLRAPALWEEIDFIGWLRVQKFTAILDQDCCLSLKSHSKATSEITGKILATELQQRVCV